MPIHANLNPYIHFNGNAREALEFYAQALGDQADIMTFGDYRMEGMPEDKVMHGQIKVDGKIVFMASDAPDDQGSSHEGFSVCLSGMLNNADELRGYWQKLQDGATVRMPLKKEVWGDEFGMLTDKFGIDWMVDIASENQINN